MPCGTLLIVLDVVIYSGGIMVSKCIHTRDHFYAYVIPEFIIRNHINTNLYKYTVGGGGSIKSVYVMIKMEGIQCSVKVRGQIFNIQVNVCYDCVQFIMVQMNSYLSVRF